MLDRDLCFPLARTGDLPCQACRVNLQLGFVLGKANI